MWAFQISSYNFLSTGVIIGQEEKEWQLCSSPLTQTPSHHDHPPQVLWNVLSILKGFVIGSFLISFHWNEMFPYGSRALKNLAKLLK